MVRTVSPLVLSGLTCHAQPGHHLGERVGVDLALVQAPVTLHHPGYRELPLNTVRRHVDSNSGVLKTRYFITFPQVKTRGVEGSISVVF